MKILPAIITLLVLSSVAMSIAGCKVEVDDKRTPREELMKAFQQRDLAIEALFKRIEVLEDAKSEEPNISVPDKPSVSQ